MSKDRLLSDEELKKECLARVALQEYGTTPSNLSGEQLGKIGFASVDLYQFINTQKRLYAESVIDNVIEDVAGYQAMSNRATVTVKELMNPDAGFRAYAKDLAEQRARIK